MKRLICLLSAALAVFCLCACNVDYTEEELKTAASELLEKSYEVNVIVYGKGLDADYSDTDGGGQYTEGLLQYGIATEECGYKTTAELKSLVAEVYSAKMASTVNSLMFDGLTVEIEGESEPQVVTYARYYDSEAGLKVRLDNPDKVIEIRQYDTDKITVEKTEKNSSVISVPVKDSGESATFTLVREEGVWRLDTPAY